jgi:hypothetical protein
LPAVLGSRRKNTKTSKPVLAGTLATTGVGRVRTTSSLSATTSLPLTRTPPRATPSTTGRVSESSAMTAPLEVCASAVTLTVPSPRFSGDTTDPKRSPSMFGIVTTTLELTRFTIEPGM